ncbi:DNA polymerase epsilon subunit 4 [Grus japonensis]|uniref:DNA polymerase epsilon subunit 4 n=1 Tax=Grus japonensis TaxID=30415 RepID=A0ABC9XTI7_GRUJA
MAAAAAAAVPVLVAGAEVAGPGEEAAGAGPPGSVRLARLPLARVKALVKADPDVSLASQEAVFVLARATSTYSSILTLCFMSSLKSIKPTVA